MSLMNFIFYNFITLLHIQYIVIIYILNIYILSNIESETSLWDWLFVRRSVKTSLKGGKLHFYAPIGALVLNKVCNIQAFETSDRILSQTLSTFFIYSVSTNFRLKLVEPSAREVEGQQFYRVSLDLSVVLFSLAPTPGSFLSARV